MTVDSTVPQLAEKKVSLMAEERAASLVILLVRRMVA